MMKKLFSFIQFHYSCVEIYSLLSEFGSFMSKSLLLLNYQSDRLLSAPQFCCWLLTEIGG